MQIANFTGQNATNFQTNIKNQIIEIFSFEYLRKQRSLVLSNITFWDSLFSAIHFGIISAGISKMDCKVKSLYDKRHISDKKYVNKFVIYSIDSFVSNNSTVQQNVQIPFYSLKVNQTEEIIINHIADISSISDIDVSFAFETFPNISKGIKLSGASSETKMYIEQIEISTHKETIILPPMTKMNITYNFYQFDDIENYLLDFIVDESSRISIPDYENDLYDGNLTHFQPFHIFTYDATISTPLIDFLRNNSFILQKLDKEDETVIKIEEIKRNMILRNIPLIKRITKFGVSKTFGDPEKI